MTSLAASPIDGAILAQRAGHEVRSPVSPAAVTQAGGSTESRLLAFTSNLFLREQAHPRHCHFRKNYS